MVRTMRVTAAAAAIGLLAGCTTTSKRPPAAAAATAPPPMPMMPVDPWARSTPSAPAQRAPSDAAAPAVDEPAAAMPAEDAPPQATSSAGRTHVVAKGETLFAISSRYYGSGTKWPKIAEANPGLKPERMPVGKTIVIP